MKRESAQAHARRAYYCTCGRVVHGNGARAQHLAMHTRRQEKWGFVARAHFILLWPAADPLAPEAKP